MEKLNNDIINRFLQGKASKSELIKVANYIYSKEATEDITDILKEELLNKYLVSDFDKDESIRNILKEINNEDETSVSDKSKKRGIFFKVAASLSIIVLASYFVVWLFGINQKVPSKIHNTYATEVKSTQKGQKMQFKLPDGSMVYLNAASKIEFIADFADGQRKVFIDGEAFFDVVSDSLNPFTVEANQFEVKVLGTKFNVNNGLSKASVSLIEGKVALKHTNGNKLDMNPGEVVFADQSGLIVSDQEIDVVTGWKDGWLYFNGDNLDEIIKKLEKWYGITFEVHGNQSDKFHYTGKFRNKSLEEVLQGISFVMMFDFEIKNERVELSL